ncbi:MAG: reprolysin-like metallopeptidase [Flavobacterium sp.]
MKKALLLLVSVLFVTLGYSQTDKLWSPVSNRDGIIASKTTERISFPREFKLFQLNLTSFRQVLMAAPDKFSGAKGVLISIPNSEGSLEQFEMFESSNFEPALQVQFPEIRSYVGRGVTDKTAQLRLSAAPNGVQAMFFRADRRDEFMESYSADGSIYAVYISKREKSKLPFTCSTVDVETLNGITNKINPNSLSDNGSYKTMRLALSCTAEYANYFGSTTANPNVSLVLTAMNNTMTRVNGIFETDLAIHMNLIANESAIIYFDPTSDPYSDASAMQNWNSELQGNLTSTITEGVYDIGHLFGATGGGGNAGCIGCVCVDGQKGSGITSPADGIPAGDNFDVDYVAHEMGHQMGARHTFTYGGSGTSGEDSTVNVEPGSGVTIMAYAGITNDNTSATPITDVAPHSIPIFTYRSILQIQTNMAPKTCPVSTTIPNSLTISVPSTSYTIPKGTAFILTGSGNASSYVWEQNDDATVSSTIETARANSLPSPTKMTGPNFRTFNPTTTPIRYCPTFSSVIAGNLSPTTTLWETVSTVGRTLNFTLTGRNNAAAGSGQTKTATMSVVVSGTVGPFTVTSQTTAEAWVAGESRTITWNVNSANTLSGSTNVDIMLSTDGGLTFTTVLTPVGGVANSGTATITVPNVTSQTCRLMVKPTGNIYYAVNSSPFYIGYSITNTCTTYNYTTPFALPDNGSNYTIKSLAVPTTTGTITDVNINVNVTHPNIQNLVIAVVRPGGTSPVNLFNQNCSGNANMNVTFDTQGAALVCASPTSGTYQPTGNLASYNGLNPTGNWQVGFWDKVAGNVGTVNSFSIQVCTQTITPLANSSFSFENFSLYPNPNSGSFKVKFNSNSNSPIQIGVFDMSGRQIFNQSFENSGLFDQNVELNSAQTGIYLVNIQDGEQKITKKIIVE